MSKLERINYGDIHDMLSNQMAEIASNKMTGDELTEEILKANAMTGLASSIINLGKLQLQGSKQFGKDEAAEGLFVIEKPTKG